MKVGQPTSPNPLEAYEGCFSLAEDRQPAPLSALSRRKNSHHQKLSFRRPHELASGRSTRFVIREQREQRAVH
jgi:hypothetical protein